MAGSKKNKAKKSSTPLSRTSEPPSNATAVDDEDLMDELMAQLDSKDTGVQMESAHIINDMQIKKSADTSEPQRHVSTDSRQSSKSRHQARQARKAAMMVESQPPGDPTAEAKLFREAEEEKRTIYRICDELDLEIHEITPDGHCLFSAVADQLCLLSILPPEKATYATARHAAADYIQNHPDDFLPFLPSAEESSTGLMSQAEFEKYCAIIRDTGAWGGEPEILALSRVYNVPIHVVQGTTPPVVIHDPSGKPGKHTDPGVARISYHRRMYGLGEHYNSLRPRVRKSFTERLSAAFSGPS